MPRINKAKRSGVKEAKSAYDPFYVTARWRKLRALKKQKNPLCEICKSQGKLTKMYAVDHHKGRRIFPELELDMSNLTSICARHHQQKTTEEKKCNTKAEWHSVFDHHRKFKK